MIKYGNANIETIENGKIQIKKENVAKKTAHEKAREEAEFELFNLSDRLKS